MSKKLLCISLISFIPEIDEATEAHCRGKLLRSIMRVKKKIVEQWTHGDNMETVSNNTQQQTTLTNKCELLLSKCIWSMLESQDFLHQSRVLEN